MPWRRFATAEPAVCCVCHRQAGGVGYAARAGQPIIWTCGDPTCVGHAREIYTMAEKDLSAIELQARNDAGAQAGGWLDEKGFADTPLGQVPEEIWFGFLTQVVQGFENAMRRHIAEGTPPF